MKRLILTILMLAVTALALFAELPTCYYNYAQISQMLDNYQSQHPDIARKHLIGFSQQDNVPIYAMQISDNVMQQEEEPALLFVGQVHAEEVLGVQIVMSNIHQILNQRYQTPFSQWIAQLDMWFVPTLNPEGHNVVTANLDTSYRKNKRDNNNNGIFDYSPLVGYDIDGVDLNRNMDFNWVHGDSLMQGGGLEVWDYYRGPAAESESELQAIKALSDQKKFVYSIAWHSSRTGNFSEKVYYSFNWKEIRPSPDIVFFASIANGTGAQIIKEAGGASYEVSPNLSRKGAFHDWMYQRYGTVQLLIEAGTRNLQPDSLLMVNTVDRCKLGVWWMLNRSLPFSSSVPSSSMLTGNIRDAVTNRPLEAQIIIEEHNAPWFHPRTSHPVTGRYWRPLTTGLYTIRARKTGYYDNVINSAMVNNGSWTVRNILMQPKPASQLIGTVRSSGTPLNGKIIIYGIETDTVNFNGNFVHNSFVGTYPIEISAEGYFPYIGTVELTPGQNQHQFELSPAQILFSENWEEGTSNWQIQGPWLRQNELSVSGFAITDSWGGRGLYEMNCDVWIQTASPVFIATTNNVLLSFESHLYTEWVHDPVLVQVSTNGVDWQTLWTKSGRHDVFKTEYVPLSDFAGQSVWIRFRLTDQSNHVELTDPGWTIDNIRIISGFSSPNEDNLNPALPLSALYPNFPNPFNPETTIKYSLAAQTPVSLEIFNIRGQKVRSLVNSTMRAGNHSIVWNGRDDLGSSVSSGVYLYRMRAGDYDKTIKMMLMK
ncbi:MAG: M14 family zinc carboxypeptidase [Candidatus Cloacimonadaceae bacterium]|nr:M14 family zinc carboxypeptidase [Candidatus Cloacimonadaceae bacterium]